MAGTELVVIANDTTVLVEDVKAYAPVCPSNAPVVMSWSNLTVTVGAKPNETQLLKNLNGQITGGVWAIMGSSGSGKTTFLSALASRLDSKMTVSGDMKLNGKPYSKATLKSMSAYVMQDDLIHAHLTVLETLTYMAKLRMPRATSPKQRQDMIDHVMKIMGIEHCQNIIVGNTRVKGISGGERKRLCIAIELLTKPHLLFLDEPTSGLDSTTALAVMGILKQLATSGECTVVTTIHQPQSKIFQSFDNLILMQKGEMMYQGSASASLSYFAKLGYPCPELTNPADHLIDVLGNVHKKFTVPDAGCGNGKVLDDLFDVNDRQSWHMQFFILLQRELRQALRRWDIIVMNGVVSIILGIFVGFSVWTDMGTNKGSGIKRPAALFFCVIHEGIVASMQGSHSFPLERAIMLRERAAGSYDVSAYFLSKTITDMITQLVSPILYSCIVYPKMGLQQSTGKFFRFLGLLILDSYAATSMANMISCLFVTIELSTVVLAFSYEWCRLFGGWFISPALLVTLPEWGWADFLSYIKYAYIGLSLNEYDGLVLTCTPEERTPPNAPGPETADNCKIPPFTTQYPYGGEAYVTLYGFSDYTLSFCVGMLLAYIITCRLVAYCGLRYIKV